MTHAIDAVLYNNYWHGLLLQFKTKIIREYDLEIPQSQNLDKPVSPCGRATQQSQDTTKSKKQRNQLYLPHQDDCKTRMDIKQRTTKHRIITESHNGSNNKHRITNNRKHCLRMDSQLQTSIRHQHTD